MNLLQRLGASWRSLTGAVHPRDPSLADMFGSYWGAASGIVVTPDTAMRSPAVASSIRLLSESVATIPLDLFERTGPETVRRATEQPLFALVHDAPTDWLSSVDWRRRMMNSVLKRGNQYNRIYSNGAGGVDRIEPLGKTSCFPFRSDGKIFYRITTGTGAFTATAAEVLHIRGPLQEGDDLEAASPILMNRELIGGSIAAAEYIARFFSNGATPKVAIELPVGVSDDAARLLREAFERRHQGLENAHKAAFVDGGMKIVPLATNNNDAQTLELYRALSSEVASRVFGIPPHLSGDMEKQSSWGTGIEQMDIGYLKHAIRPYLEGIEAALNMALLTPAGRQKYYFEFNVEGLLRGDFKTRMEGYALLVQWGIATINEVRRRENLPPIAGGDERMHPLNMVPASRVMDVLLKNNPATAARDLFDLRHETGHLNGKAHADA